MPDRSLSNPLQRQPGLRVSEFLFPKGDFIRSEALEAINEAEVLAERFEQRDYSDELHRLRGVFLAAMGADETQIEASFCEAIRVAKQHKSVSMRKRAEATYAEYRRQRAIPGARGIRLPLW